MIPPVSAPSPSLAARAYARSGEHLRPERPRLRPVMTPLIDPEGMFSARVTCGAVVETTSPEGRPRSVAHACSIQLPDGRTISSTVEAVGIASRRLVPGGTSHLILRATAAGFSVEVFA